MQTNSLAFTRTLELNKKENLIWNKITILDPLIQLIFWAQSAAST